jgi:hypothetical protein
MTKKIDDIKNKIDQYIRIFVISNRPIPKYIRVQKSHYDMLRKELGAHMKDMHKNYYPYRGHKIVPLYGVKFPDEEE